MANNDTVSKTLIVAISLCVVCSVIVSGAAVLLKDRQVANVLEDRNRNILAAAGLLEEGVSVSQQFERVDVRLVDLRTGKFSEEYDAQSFNQRSAAKDPQLSTALDAAEDIASLGRRENYAPVYLVLAAGEIEKVILPIYGAGLWGKLYGFVALEADGNTVAGLGFYEHKETPGLGGEVDNPRWKSIWPGKQVYRDGEVAIGLVKGAADSSSSYEIDGLAGATLTSRGVTNLVQFWLGADGFGPFINNLIAGEA